MVNDNNDRRRNRTHNPQSSIRVPAVIPLTLGILSTFALLLLVSITIAPLIYETPISVEVYTFLVRLCALWAGLTWLTASIYLSLITDAGEHISEIWVSFWIGAMMSYVGVAGVYVDIRYWLGIRALTYVLFATAALIFIANTHRNISSEYTTIRLKSVIQLWATRLVQQVRYRRRR